jgi:hypothetical protein
MLLLKTGFISSCLIFFGQYLCTNSLIGQKCYRGWADDVFPMKICLDLSNAKDVQGNYTFVHTNLNFDLQGFRKGDTIQLLEFDESGLISGYLFLNIQSDQLIGKWVNTTKSLESEIQCFDPGRKFVSDNCASNKWIKSIEFPSSDGPTKVVLIRSAQHIAYGYMSGPHGGTDHIRGICLDRVCSELSIESSKALGDITRIQFQGRDEATLVADNGKKTVGTVTDIWSLNCQSKIAYTGSADIQYPVIDEVFQKYILGRVEAWMQEIDFRRKLEFGDPSDLPENRWASRFYSWLEIDLINDRFISGVLELIGPDGGVDGFAFNYDMGKKEFMDIDKYLKGDLNVEDLSVSFHGYNDKYIPKWKYTTISQNGIVLRTAYDPIFGFHRATLSFEEYDKQIKGSLIKIAKSH